MIMIILKTMMMMAMMVMIIIIIITIGITYSLIWFGLTKESSSNRCVVLAFSYLILQSSF